MSEREFAAEVVKRLALHGHRCLRICDYVEGRRGVFGLQAQTSPLIKSPGADFLVLPDSGMDCILAREMERIPFRRPSPFFLELKDPLDMHNRKRKDQVAQQEWMRWVEGLR